jgi:L-ascorbate metabolism protein UlaG (beta-lactamase superfamily)
VKADAVKANYILLSHGHGDHLGDTIAIAKRTGAPVITNFEVGEWLKKKGLAADKVIGMNPGGGVEQPFGHVKFTMAYHSSSMPDGTYGGVPGGFLLKLADSRVYFACDTSAFLDMKMNGTGGLDLAVLPIGDLYTMGPEESIDAIKLLNPKRVAPCHYGTFPAIKQDAAAWADRVRSHTAAEPIVLQPGGQISL